jgi:hypothetical protein
MLILALALAQFIESRRLKLQLQTALALSQFHIIQGSGAESALCCRVMHSSPCDSRRSDIKNEFDVDVEKKRTRSPRQTTNYAKLQDKKPLL